MIKSMVETLLSKTLDIRIYFSYIIQPLQSTLIKHIREKFNSKSEKFEVARVKFKKKRIIKDLQHHQNIHVDIGIEGGGIDGIQGSNSTRRDWKASGAGGSFRGVEAREKLSRALRLLVHRWHILDLRHRSLPLFVLRR